MSFPKNIIKFRLNSVRNGKHNFVPFKNKNPDFSCYPQSFSGY